MKLLNQINGRAKDLAGVFAVIEMLQQMPYEDRMKVLTAFCTVCGNVVCNCK